MKGIQNQLIDEVWLINFKVIILRKGALLYEMLSGAPPFYSKDRDKMFKNILFKPIEMRPYFS